MEGKVIVRVLGKLETGVCCECKKSATHGVNSKIESKEVFTCNVEICMVPHLFGRRG